MTFREDLLPVVDSIRGIAGPSGVDIRTTQLTIRKRSWSGECIGLGVATDTDLVLPQIYKVRNISAHEVASSGGRYEMEDVNVGPITPEYSGGGYSADELKPIGDDKTEIIYVLSGGNPGEYRLVQLNTGKAFRYELILRRTRRTP